LTTFALELQDAKHTQRLTDVTAFVGEDRSGSFGILAGHARFMTSLTFGLARFRTLSADWQYLALPGALLYFKDNVLSLSTRHYLIDSDYTRITSEMNDQLVAEEQALTSLKTSLRRMEEEALRRMWRLGQVEI
jgi:F-type H+-transporting ATPase subunit epsilon